MKTPGVSRVFRETSAQRIAIAVTYAFYKHTPLSLGSDALAAFDFAQAVSLSNGVPPGAPSPLCPPLGGPPSCSPSGVPHRFRECRSGTMVLARNSGNSSEDGMLCCLSAHETRAQPKRGVGKAIASDFVTLLSLIQGQDKGVVITIIAGDFPE
jgi:hypothetical protein